MHESLACFSYFQSASKSADNIVVKTTLQFCVYLSQLAQIQLKGILVFLVH